MSHVKSPHGASLLAKDWFIVTCLVEKPVKKVEADYMEIPSTRRQGDVALVLRALYCTYCHLENPSAGGWTSRLHEWPISGS